MHPHAPLCLLLAVRLANNSEFNKQWNCVHLLLIYVFSTVSDRFYSTVSNSSELATCKSFTSVDYMHRTLQLV